MNKSQLNYSTLDSAIRKNLQKLIIELEVADKLRRKGKNRKAHENNIETLISFQKIFGDLFFKANLRLRTMIKNNEILFLSENQKRLINNFVFTGTRIGEYKSHKGQVWTKNSEDIVYNLVAFY